MVAFEDHHDFLVMFQAEVDEWGLAVQPVAGHRVEVPAVAGEDSLQEALGGGHFPLAGLLKLDVQGNRQFLPDQVADDAAMIVFGDVLITDL